MRRDTPPRCILVRLLTQQGGMSLPVVSSFLCLTQRGGIPLPVASLFLIYWERDQNIRYAQISQLIYILINCPPYSFPPLCTTRRTAAHPTPTATGTAWTRNARLFWAFFFVFSCPCDTYCRQTQKTRPCGCVLHVPLTITTKSRFLPKPAIVPFPTQPCYVLSTYVPALQMYIFTWIL